MLDLYDLILILHGFDKAFTAALPFMLKGELPITRLKSLKSTPYVLLKRGNRRTVLALES